MFEGERAEATALPERVGETLAVVRQNHLAKVLNALTTAACKQRIDLSVEVFGTQLSKSHRLRLPEVVFAPALVNGSVRPKAAILGYGAACGASWRPEAQNPDG